MTVTVVTRLKDKIDRMRITVPLKPDQYKMAWSILPGIADPTISGSLDLKHWKGRYRTGLILKDGVQSIAQVIAGSSQTQYRYWQWELWPDAINSIEHAQAWEKFQSLFDILASDNDPTYSLSHAMDTGKISYIEVARDFAGAEKEKIIPWATHARKGFVFKDHGKGINGTTYLGSKDSPRNFAIYDKKQQLKDKGLPCPYPSLLRVEVRLRAQGILVKEIEQLETQFQHLHIASAPKARTLFEEKSWQTFIETAENEGAASAFSMLTKHHRKVYRERLMQCTPKWWALTKNQSNLKSTAS